ncbi:MAG: hypothetical protein AB8B99_11165 [Phormidesmis sp.]
MFFQPLVRVVSSAAIAAIVAGFGLGARSAQAEDPVGSYGGVSYGIDRSDNLEIGAEGVYSFTDNLQIRATLGDGLFVLAPTVSVSAGQWRFAAGPGLKYSESSSTVAVEVQDSAGNTVLNENGAPQTNNITVQDNDFDLIGVVNVERAFGEFFVVFGSVNLGEDTSGAIGGGVKF